MSRKRQDDIFVCTALRDPVTTLTHEFPNHHQIPRHVHPEHQLIYACRGVMTVWTLEGSWIVPPQRAVWIPARTPHAITMHGAVSMRTLYVKPRLLRLSPNCCVVKISPLQLIHPSDPRAARIAETLSKDPGDTRSLEAICERAGASRRTIERIFLSETNMSLGRWRQQLRLACSLRLLATGEKITRVAFETGYSTPSAFIAMFRKALGTTP